MPEGDDVTVQWMLPNFYSRPEVQVWHGPVTRQLYETDALEVVYHDANKHWPKHTPCSRGGTRKEVYTCGKAGRKAAYQTLPISQGICLQGRIHLHVNQCTLNRLKKNVGITHSRCKTTLTCQFCDASPTDLLRNAGRTGDD